MNNTLPSRPTRLGGLSKEDDRKWTKLPTRPFPSLAEERQSFPKLFHGARHVDSGELSSVVVGGSIAGRALCVGGIAPDVAVKVGE